MNKNDGLDQGPQKEMTRQFILFVLALCIAGLFNFFINYICVLISFRSTGESLGQAPIRAVNLGGWLLVEGWMKPSLFANLANGDMLDGAMIQLRSSQTNAYIRVEKDRVFMDSSPSSFRLWRVSSTMFQLRDSSSENFIKALDAGGGYLATSQDAREWETFKVIRGENDKVHIKAFDNTHYLQVTGDQVTADYTGEPSWEDSNPAVFYMNKVKDAPLGEYQLSNAFDNRDDASKVLEDHRNSFITSSDFTTLVSSRNVNTVRIPVGWWIKYDPNPPLPHVAGSLSALDNAFTWAESTGIKIIIDLHAAPGAQGVEAHSGSRDGTSKWDPSASLEVIDFLAQRYSKREALLGIELLNEPHPWYVSFEALEKYYKEGYETVRKYSPDVKVILCQFVPGDSKDVSKLIPAGAFNVVLDVHLYTAFSNLDSTQSNINVVNTDFKNTVSSLSAINGAQVFVGEWANVLTSEDRNDANYNRFGSAQLQVFSEASFGWAYWSFRNFASDKQWSFENSVLPYNNAK